MMDESTNLIRGTQALHVLAEVGRILSEAVTKGQEFSCDIQAGTVDLEPKNNQRRLIGDGSYTISIKVKAPTQAFQQKDEPSCSVPPTSPSSETVDCLLNTP